MDNHVDLIKSISLESGILHLILNRPEQLNALSHELLQRLSDIIQQTHNNPTIKALLISGEGKGFCAGADIKQLAGLNGQSGFNFAQFGQMVFRRLELLGKPSLAAIHGFAFGGGCELAMAASLRIATKTCVFGQPEIKLGVIPGFGGTQRLSRLIGKGRALELCLTGKKFSAEDAWRWGLVNELVESDQLLDRAKEFLSEIIQLSPIALRSILTVINQGYDIPLEEAQDLEASHFALCCTTTDKREGVNAFLEKRTANFIGE